VFGTGLGKASSWGKRKERGKRMSTRKMLREVASKGDPCPHCGARGTCACDSCVQNGGTCGRCGGMQFLPRVTLDEIDFGEAPSTLVRLARRPKRERRPRLVA